MVLQPPPPVARWPGLCWLLQPSVPSLPLAHQTERHLNKSEDEASVGGEVRGSGQKVGEQQAPRLFGGIIWFIYLFIF